MLKTHSVSLLRVHRADELPPGGPRAAYCALQLLFVLIGSVTISAASLCLAFGNYDWDVFFGYFRSPLILLLNTLPVFLLELLLYSLFNHHWLSCLGSLLLILLPSVGNYFKIRFRYEPFMVRDIPSIRAGLSIAREYTFTLNARLLLVAALAAVLFLLSCFLHGRLSRKPRLTVALLVLLSVFPLWRLVYSSAPLYQHAADTNLYLANLTQQERFISTGFAYPFLYSITYRSDTVPEGYDAAEAAALIERYEDTDIPAQKRVSLLILQLESFTDLEAKGLTGVDPSVYAAWHRLEEESLHGTMVANVIGGGTIDTERCLMTGSYGMQSYTRDASSHIRYLASQGYRTTGCHPNKPDFYNRINVNRYLGFEQYDFVGSEGSPVTAEWGRDAVFLPEVFRTFREQLAGGAPVFSLDVSLQGHSPYNAESRDYDSTVWHGEGSEITRNILNNYLGSVEETQRLLVQEMDGLRGLDEPVLVLVYGDHNPYLYSEAVYAESGLKLDLSTDAGILDYYGTPYLLWANEAAKPLLEKELAGEGPTISPGYFMNLIFEYLGLRGSAWMQFTDSIRAELPVVNSNGYYYQNGRFVSAPDEAGQKLLHDYLCAQFFYRYSYKKDDTHA